MLLALELVLTLVTLGLLLTCFKTTHREKREMCCRPRAGRVEEEVRQARAVELIAQKRLLDLHMRSQVCASCHDLFHAQSEFVTASCLLS